MKALEQHEADDLVVGNLPATSCPLVPAAERARYLATNDRRARDAGKFYAELGAGEAQWHLLRHAPGKAKLALAHLVGRRFGCYQPEWECKIVYGDGRSVRYQIEPIFRGYLFLWAWDVAAHMRRLLACPGVIGVLHNDGRPVIVPQHVMTEIQAIECRNIAERERGLVFAGKRYRNRRAPRDPAFRATMSCKSYLAGIDKLDPDGRIGLLAKALGLASQPDLDQSLGGGC